MSDCCILWWCWWETRHPGRTIILFTSPYATSPSLGLCIYGSYLTGINWKSLRVGSQTRKGGAGSLSSRLPSRFPTPLHCSPLCSSTTLPLLTHLLQHSLVDLFAHSWVFGWLHWNHGKNSNESCNPISGLMMVNHKTHYNKCQIWLGYKILNYQKCVR